MNVAAGKQVKDQLRRISISSEYETHILLRHRELVVQFRRELLDHVIAHSGNDLESINLGEIPGVAGECLVNLVHQVITQTFVEAPGCPGKASLVAGIPARELTGAQKSAQLAKKDHQVLARFLSCQVDFFGFAISVIEVHGCCLHFRSRTAK
ncbi:hypothetical protein D3C78_1453040 [compost metagenome]